MERERARLEQQRDMRAARGTSGGGGDWMPGWELGVICGSVIVAVLLVGLLVWWLVSRRSQQEQSPEAPRPLLGRRHLC